ncbi:MAG: thiamine pyrophosphate-binding protein [Alphaproteobacteria bacterium]|jgi:acetolactate synthase-1/2/3 large subunit|nr:thiamine pyrophosphate-binding protein [Alphaproteobacteria bacterium]
MARMTGGQALVRSLIGNGVDTLFGLPGVQLDHLFNALHDEGNAIRVLNARHEQGVAYMALGYAMASGDVGTYAVVPGPGVLNTTAALSTAYAVNARVLCVTGQIPAAYIGRGLGMLHEIPDQLGVLQGLTKWSARIEHPTAAPGDVAEAFRQLRSGRPQPVGLEMALDLMADEAEVGLLGAAEAEPGPALDPDLVTEAAALLGQAKRPVIFVGGGVFGAEAELQALAEMLQAPVISNRNGRGALSDHHYLSLTYMAGHRLWADADVVLAVGSRLQPPRMNWGTDDGLKIIHVEIDPQELRRVAKPDVALLADAKPALAALADAVAKVNIARDSREDELTTLRAEVKAMFEDRLAPQMAWLEVLRRSLDEDGIFVDELTQVGYVARPMFPVYRPRSFLSSGYQGTLGYGLATAIGAKVACPDKQVLAIAGDGGLMYNIQELASAVHHGIPLVVVVFADGAFGNVKRMQQELHGGRVVASDFTNPDFVRLAESFGAAGYRAETPAVLESTIAEAFKQNGPALIEVPIEPMPDPWKIIIPGRIRPTA